MDELKAMIKDAIGKEMSDKWEEVVAKAKEANAKDPAYVAAMMAGKDPNEPKAGEKGIKFARFVRALAAGGGRRDMAAEWAKDKLHDDIVASALRESSFEEGGALVLPEFASEIIELLRAKTVVRALGARSVPMRGGTFSIPYQKTSTTAYYVGEGVAPSVSKPTLGMLTLTAKKLITITPVSNDLIADASYDADSFVRDDILQNMRVKEDATFLRGLGVESTPKGIRYLTDSSHIFARTKAGSASTLAEVFADLGKMIRVVEEANVPMEKCGWAMAPRTKWFLMTLLNSNGIPVFRDEMLRGTLLTFPFKTTTSIPTNLGTGSNESELYFADYNSILIGETKNISLATYEGGAYQDGDNVISGISTDQTVVKATARHDIGMRFRGLEASVLTTVDWA
jgi:HK97 family phage major capsid protein